MVVVAVLWPGSCPYRMLEYTRELWTWTLERKRIYTDLLYQSTAFAVEETMKSTAGLVMAASKLARFVPSSALPKGLTQANRTNSNTLDFFNLENVALRIGRYLLFGERSITRIRCIEDVIELLEHQISHGHFGLFGWM
jgi:hypothetical protein